MNTPSDTTTPTGAHNLYGLPDHLRLAFAVVSLEQSFMYTSPMGRLHAHALAVIHDHFEGPGGVPTSQPVPK